MTQKENPDIAAVIKDAYYNLFIKAMRVPVGISGLHSASTPYQGYSMDQAPLSLCERNAVINGVTEDGIHVIGHSEERFSKVKTSNGEYLQTWFEYLPEEVLNHTAPAGTVPLILANHGGGDDPRQFSRKSVCFPWRARERFPWLLLNICSYRQYLTESLPLSVEYSSKPIPDWNHSRVWTGYSMGAQPL